jgi:hypothetical protein
LETFGGYRHFDRINGNLNLINEIVLLLDYLINTVDSRTSWHHQKLNIQLFRNIKLERLLKQSFIKRQKDMFLMVYHLCVIVSVTKSLHRVLLMVA